MQFKEFNSQIILNDFLKHLLTQILRNRLQQLHQHEEVHWVVAGGKTPYNLYQELARLDLPWEKIKIYLTDERWLSPDHLESNEYLLKHSLLTQAARKAQFLSFYSANNIQEAVEKNDLMLQKISTFDFVLLGMGEDGHTASLFPCSQEITEGLHPESKSVIAVNPRTAPFQRISQTKRRLENTNYIFLYLIGPTKLEAFNRAVAGKDCWEMPIRAFIHHPHLDLQVFYAPY